MQCCALPRQKQSYYKASFRKASRHPTHLITLAPPPPPSPPAHRSDPIYAEAYVTVHQYDIVLDVTVINRTGETMQVCVCVCNVGPGGGGAAGAGVVVGALSAGAQVL